MIKPTISLLDISKKKVFMELLIYTFFVSNLDENNIEQNMNIKVYVEVGRGYPDISG